MSTIEPLSDFSRKGTAAATALTVCIMSVANDFAQVSGESPTARALTLHTSTSMPPSASALAVIQALKALASVTSTARPKAGTPFFFSAATAASTSPRLRAQSETPAPSSAKVSAMARPMPLVPPVMSAACL